MNETESLASTPAPAPTPDQGPPEIACLQKQINYLTIALLIASMTFCVYLWRQQRIARYDLANFKVIAVQVINNYQKEKPQVEAFVEKVAEYGIKHPDFAPIMNKYPMLNKYRDSASTNSGAIRTSTGAAPAQAR